MEGPAVSIIVPVYNVKPYLEKCLSSIRFQTCRDFEVLLVDDGSTDGSADICRSYVALDSRFGQCRRVGGTEPGYGALRRAVSPVCGRG